MLARRSAAFPVMLALVAMASASRADELAQLLEFETASGDPVSMATFRGKPALVDIWASWCAPCVEALPHLAAINRKYGKDLAVVPISVDRGGAATAVAAYARKRVAGLPLYAGDAEPVMAAFGARYLPTTILFDADGREVARFGPAATRDNAAFEQAIERLLRSSTPRNDS